MKGNYDLSQLIKIVMYRTMDESIVKLQRNYEEFKIKEPIYNIDDDGYVIAKIGLKEGISVNSRFEVLERIETADGEPEGCIVRSISASCIFMAVKLVIISDIASTFPYNLPNHSSCFRAHSSR